MQELVSDTCQKRLVPSMATHYFHTHPSKGTLVTTPAPQQLAAYIWSVVSHDSSVHHMLPHAGLLLSTARKDYIPPVLM